MLMSIKGILDRVSDVLLIIAAAVMAIMMFHVGADVIAKRVFGAPIIGTLEMVSLFYMVAVIFLPLAVVQKDREHIFVELFTQKLSAKWIRFLDAIALLLMLALTIILCWKGSEVAIEKMLAGEMSPNVEFDITVWQGRWFPVIGFALTAAYALIFLISELLSVISGRPSELPKKHSNDENEGV